MESYLVLPFDRVACSPQLPRSLFGGRDTHLRYPGESGLPKMVIRLLNLSLYRVKIVDIVLAGCNGHGSAA